MAWVRREGAITLHAIRKYFPWMSVAEVYAWRVDEGDVFICMEHMRGRTLSPIFEEMTFPEHAQVICHPGTAQLRLLKQTQKGQWFTLKPRAIWERQGGIRR